MSVEALKQYTLRAKYARYNREAKRRETYAEATNRVRNMMLGLYPQLNQQINWAYDLVIKQRILGSQRALQFGGRPALQHNARVYNCTSSYCDRLRFFQEAFYLLLCGCGTGFSVQRHHIAKLPAFAKHRLEDRKRHKELVRNGGMTFKLEKTFVIPDSIEGWSDALGVLLSSYFEDPIFEKRESEGEFEDFYGVDVEFDYSLIRPEGSYLSSGAGKAPGPEPLRKALEKIRELLNRCLRDGQSRLRPIDAYDIVMHASDAVLAGGVRRSATICIFSLDDMEMMKAKTGNWMADNPQRGRSNNSVLLVRNETTKEQFEEVMRHVREWGEPGFYWSDSTEQLPNPCQPAWAKVLTRNGIRTIGEVKVGDEIWSETGWTKIVKKWSTGINKVYKYETTAGVFYGTKGHKIVSNGMKIEAGQAESVDILAGPDGQDYQFKPSQSMVDGLVLGDGTVHEASNRKVVLLVGSNDKDYFTSEIRSFIGKKSSIGPYAYEVKTTIQSDELPLTFLRRIPERFIRGNNSNVCSFLRGLFSANGSICGQRVTLKSTSHGLIEDVQMMLSAVGIRSYVTTNPTKTVNFENGPYECRESYDLNITADRVKFRRLIGFLQKYKNEKLDDVISSLPKIAEGKKTYDIVAITEVSEEETFDITVDNPTHTYWTQCINVSNCVEIGFYPQYRITTDSPVLQELLVDYKGPVGTDGCDALGREFVTLSGWQFCNLATINGQLCPTPEYFYEACEGAATLGTLQAGLTSFPYLGKVTELIVRREALLGVSITGVMDSPNVLLQPEVLREGARRVLAVNEMLAPQIGIEPCARGTCLKPEGTTSCLLGTASGAGPWKFRRGFRRVQANRNEPVAKFFAEKNPWAVEKSVWCANGTTNVITFCLEAPPGAIVEGDLTAVEYLDVIKLIQENWVRPGKRHELCTQPWLTHNVSNTVVVKDYEWNDVINHIYKNRESYAGISLLAASGDKDYPQAPFAAVYNPEEIEKQYGPTLTNKAYVLLPLIMEAYDGDVWRGCEDILNDNLTTPNHSVVATAYMMVTQNDIKRLTYAIKDIANWQQWQYLQEMYRDVDYNKLIEDGDNTKPQEELACVGGACQI